MAVKKKNLVEKRNVLNEVRKNNMTLQQLRFFSIYLSRINARDVSTRVVKFPLDDFRRIMEIGKINIPHFQSVTDGLLSKVINVPREDGGYEAFQLFKRCKVYQNQKGNWFVEIDAHDDALPLMFDFKKDYFTYELWNALRLKSANQLRMYELLKQYEKVGERTISLIDLKRWLGIDEKEYPRWDNFKARVLESCKDALLENTDIKFEYKPIKIGRNPISAVKFFIYKNEDYIDQLTLEEFISTQDDDDVNIYDEPYVDDEENIVDVPAEPVKIQMFDDKGNAYWVLESDLLRIPTEEEVNHPDSYKYSDDEDIEEDKPTLSPTDIRLLAWLPEECKPRLEEIRIELTDFFACGNIPVAYTEERDAILIKILKRVNATYNKKKEEGVIGKAADGYYLGILKNKIESGEFDKFIIMPEETSSKTSYDIKNVGKNTILENLNKKAK